MGAGRDMTEARSAGEEAGPERGGEAGDGGVSFRLGFEVGVGTIFSPQLRHNLLRHRCNVDLV